MLIVLCMIFLIIFIVGLIFLFKDEYFEKYLTLDFVWRVLVVFVCLLL